MTRFVKECVSGSSAIDSFSFASTAGRTVSAQSRDAMWAEAVDAINGGLRGSCGFALSTMSVELESASSVVDHAAQLNTRKSAQWTRESRLGLLESRASNAREPL